MNLIRFQISGFKGLASFEATPNGHSVELRGSNGSGKSSAIDAIYWSLGGAIDGEVVNNGADSARVEVRFGDYLITRTQAKGKPARLVVKDSTGRTYPSPAALLAGFLGAVERQGFSARTPKQQAEILRRLAPGLDCGDLDAERARLYEERTGVNRDVTRLRVEHEAIVVPAAPSEVGEEIDVAEVAAKKAGVEKQRAANEKRRDASRSAQDVLAARRKAHAEAHAAVEEARIALANAEDALQQCAGFVAESEAAVADYADELAALVDPDTTAIDAEIAAAKQHNAAVRQRQQAAQAAIRAADSKLAAEKKARDAKATSDRLTARIDAIDEEKRARTAAAALPIAGLALTADAVTLDDGTHGPVEIAALNTATRARLDVAIAAALGHRLVAVRDASLLDESSRAEVAAFARQHGVQTICEVVASGEPLTAVIEEAPEVEAPDEL